MRNRKTDANQAEIVRYLQAAGVTVEDLSAVGRLPDLLLCNRAGVLSFAEIKIEGSRAVYTRTQIDWVSRTNAPVAIVKTKEAALDFANNPKLYGLTARQKNGLTSLLLRNPGKQRFTPSEVSAALVEVKTK